MTIAVISDTKLAFTLNGFGFEEFLVNFGWVQILICWEAEDGKSRILGVTRKIKITFFGDQ